MFAVTDVAQKELGAFFADKEKSTVRVYLTAGGCSGPRLALALDEAREDDTVFEDGGFSFCVKSELYNQVRDLKIDANEMGFIVKPGVPLVSDGDCGSACASCRGSCGH